MIDLVYPPLLDFDSSVVREYLFKDIIVRAALRTLWISVLAQALGVAFGVVSAVARNLRIPVLSQAASIYVWFFRGTPLLLQLFFWFFVVPQNVPVVEPERQTAALIRVLEGVPAAEAFVPGSVEIPPSLRGKIGHGGWVSDGRRT